MKKLVSTIMLLLVTLACLKHERWITPLYLALGEGEVKSYGLSKNYEIPCKSVPSVSQFCSVAYQYPIKKWTQDVSGPVGIGIGAFLTATAWSCETSQGFKRIFEIGSIENETKFRTNYNFYQMAVINPSFCTGDLFIESSRNPRWPESGWWMGPLLVGKPSVISAYKDVYGVFSSYLRVMLGLLSLVFLITSNVMNKSRVPGYSEYRMAIGTLVIMMIFTSGLVDLVFPSMAPFVVAIYSTARFVGYFYLLMSNLIRLMKYKKYSSYIEKAGDPFSLSIISLLSFGTIWFTGGLTHVPVVFVFAVAIGVSSAMLGSINLLVFSICLFCDGLSIIKIMPDFPTFSSVQFLFTSFLFYEIRAIFVRSQFSKQFELVTTNPDLFASVVYFFGNFFNIKRLSVTVESGESSVKSFFISESETVLLGENKIASKIFGHMAISKTPIVRMNNRSESYGRFFDEAEKFNKEFGTEFCIFPLLYQGKFFGTLNITNYPRTILGDVSDFSLFIEMAWLVSSEVQEAVFRSKVSPNMRQAKIALEIESELYADFNITAEKIKESLDSISKALDGRLIISTASRSAGIFHLFSVHQASIESAEGLILNTPRIDASNAYSPVNIAFHERKDVFVDRLERYDLIYQKYMTDHFKRHGTKAFYVTPIVGADGDAWGTIWAETSMNDGDGINREELTRILAHSVRRQLEFYLKHQSHAMIESALDYLVPTHVAAKIKEGLSPREEESGFILNIDLVGSTPLSKAIGERKFSVTVRQLSQELQMKLNPLGFQLQMIIWDAFIFTRNEKMGLLNAIDVEIAADAIRDSIKKTILDYDVGFRAVLHYGDITRDLKSSSNQGWGIVGSALAESCKIEAANKDKKNIVIVTEEARNFSDTTQVTDLKSMKRIS